MELEKIRQQGTEVRWQHEDDVSECGSCRDNFLTSNKTKFEAVPNMEAFTADSNMSADLRIPAVGPLLRSINWVHCSHCGQVFCQACCSKVVFSGPRQRPYQVCAVCHTLLDHTSAPYFSHQSTHPD
ncbi:RABEP1 [Cordylochernes scorpioides]|uniref:RABEP1 n=1 Tax=Cordylochernes scorpioides TaxID=51811 RepID=A0ABY6KC57_9ARAC|nr:RABEP1 [Cordylochernes scorpioides]